MVHLVDLLPVQWMLYLLTTGDLVWKHLNRCVSITLVMQEGSH